jgi:hypothetical protein
VGVVRRTKSTLSATAFTPNFLSRLLFANIHLLRVVDDVVKSVASHFSKFRRDVYKHFKITLVVAIMTTKGTKFDSIK